MKYKTTGRTVAFVDSIVPACHINVSAKVKEMPVSSEQSAPYAPASAILSIVDRQRTKGLPPIVDSEVLARAGISDSLNSRTLQALIVLDLLTEDFKPSETFERIRLAPQSEYQAALGDWLKSAYADVLQYVDPATDTEEKVRDAFRSYKPIGQQARMVTLFTSLFAAAGISSEKTRQTTPRLKPTTQGKPRENVSGKKLAPKQLVVTPVEQHQSSLPPAIQGLLASLPKEGESWTSKRRDAFHTTFGAVIDFCFPINDTATNQID
jgi:hypothetical protein